MKQKTETKQYHRELAVIKSTFFGIEDHGILAFNIDFEAEHGGWGQGTGMRSADYHDKTRKDELRPGTAFFAPFVRRFLETVGKEKWESLPGTMVWVLRASDQLHEPIIGIESVGKRKATFIFKEVFDAPGLT